MAERRRGLGRGLGALIPSGDTSEEQPDRASSPRAGDAASVPSNAPQDRAEAATATSSSSRSNGIKTKTPAKKSATSAKTPSSASRTAPNAGSKAAQPSPARSQNADNASATSAGQRTSASKGSRVEDVSRETSRVASNAGRPAEVKTKKRRDMVQALRSTTSVSRPVDMFFLPSEQEVQPHDGNDGSNGRTQRQAPGVAQKGDAQPREQLADASPGAGRKQARATRAADMAHSAEHDAPSGAEPVASRPSTEPAPTKSPARDDVSRETSSPTVSSHQTQRASSVHEAPAATSVQSDAAGTAVEDHRTSSSDVEGSSGEGKVSAENPDAQKAGVRSASGIRKKTTANRGGDDDHAAEELREVPGAVFAELSVADIHPNRKQPRQVFDEDELAELAFSVKELGVLQPVVVRPSRDEGPERYELVMGERRWRAVQAAGLDTIPAIVRETADNDLLRDALLENLHRAQLNPLEEAAAYQQLMQEFGATQEQLSERIGRSRPQISNTLRLLRLPALVQRRVAAGVLSSGHARALLALTDPADMERLAQRIVAEGLSVRATEEAVALSDGLKRSKGRRKAPSTRHDDRLGYIADAFSDKLDTSVKIQLGARKGKMTIEFASVEDLNRIIDVLDPKMDTES